MAYDQYSAYQPPPRPYYNQAPQGSARHVQSHQALYDTYQQGADEYGYDTQNRHNGYSSYNRTDMVAQQPWPSQQQSAQRRDRRYDGLSHGQAPQEGHGRAREVPLNPRDQREPGHGRMHPQQNRQDPQSNWPIASIAGSNGAPVQAYVPDGGRRVQEHFLDPTRSGGQEKNHKKKPPVARATTPPPSKQGKIAPYASVP